jgi:hypothetical protein
MDLLPLSASLWQNDKAIATGRERMSAASEFIMHGEHSLRPDRSLKIDATDWKDFRTDCAEGVFYCSQLASSLSGHLCLALVYRAPADVDDSDPTFLGKFRNWIDRLSCLALDKAKFDEQRPITIYGPTSKEVPVDGATRRKGVSKEPAGSRGRENYQFFAHITRKRKFRGGDKS